jgi:PAS domain S-box-containing protein
MKQKTHLIKHISFWGGLLIAGVAISIAAVDILVSYNAFHNRSEKMQADYIASQKESIKQEVERVVDLISHEKAQLALSTRKEIKTRVNDAYVIAQNIYQQNKSSQSKNKIQEMILTALRPIRFADGNGSYFIIHLDNKVILSADKPEKEDSFLLAAQNQTGKQPARDMIKLVRQTGEGFYEYNENKPDTARKSLQKISYVKLFKPLNWLIGTDLYLDDIDRQAQTALLETISQIRFGTENNGYIFVVSYDGTTLMNDTQRHLIGKNIWDLTDPNGIKVIQEERKAVRNPQGDFIYYTWNKPSTRTPSPKTSFVKGIEDWQWMIGAGVYLDDVDNNIALIQTKLNKQIKTKLLLFSLISTISLCLFLFLFNRLNNSLTNDTNILISFFKQAAFRNEKINRNHLRFDELDRLAENANKMLQDKLKAEGQLKMFKTFAESSSQGMGWADINGNIQYLNSAMTALFAEKDQNSSIGKNVAKTYYPEHEQQKLEEEIFPIVKNKGKWSGELTVQTINGTLIPTYNSLFLIPDKITKQIFFANIITDITDRKEAEEKQAALTEKLHQAQKMESIGLMAGGVAHDLNNILLGITGYPELILTDLPKDSKLRKPIKAIQQSGQRAAAIVADLLTIARGAASIRKSYNLHTIINEYLHSPECRKSKSLYPKVIFQHQYDAENPVISCSPVHIQKCLMNLTINACEAINGAGILAISTYNQNISEQDTALMPEINKTGEYVVLSVKDTGSGIAEKDFKHIFEPFYTKKEMGRSGSGLGLTVVWNTMKDHEGAVFVESDKTGTCFKLYFPVSRNSAIPHKNDEYTATGQREHILVVDDDAQIRDIAEKMLTKLGYYVDVVNSGESAVEFIRKQPVDLILLDMLMEPGINGRQTYEEIVKIYPDQKAVIASGFSESADVKTTLRLGANEFIKKPYTMAQLGRAIQEALKS